MATAEPTRRRTAQPKAPTPEQILAAIAKRLPIEKIGCFHCGKTAGVERPLKRYPRAIPGLPFFAHVVCEEQRLDEEARKAAGMAEETIVEDDELEETMEE